MPKSPIAAAAGAAALLLTGCLYTFNQGGGFPPHIRSMYIESFDNQTSEFGLEQLLDQKVMERVPRALGVRPAGREAADAVMTGRITRYDDVAQNYRSGASASEAIQNQVQLAVQVRIIDVKSSPNVILWESQVSGQAVYLPATQTNQDGRVAAIEQVLQRIIDGAQSQW